MKTTKEMIEVMQAYDEGKLIEVCSDNVWHPLGVFGAPDWSWGRYDYRIASPKIASGHNPDKLTEEQVGVKDGWRLLESDEIVYYGVPHDSIQAWQNTWDSSGWRGSDPSCTYRTKLSKHELRVARGLELVHEEPKVTIRWPEGKVATTTPHAPSSKDWLFTAPNWKHYQHPKILKDGTGTTLGTWKQMNDNGCTWSLDGNTWYDFNGNIVWDVRNFNSK